MSASRVCPRCNGTGHGPIIVIWCDPCELCDGDGVIEGDQRLGVCTTPDCVNVANPWNLGGMCDGCAYDRV